MALPPGYCKPGTEARVRPSLLEIAWAAGIYEGEGWANPTKRESGRYSLNVAVGQKEMPLLHRLQDLFGGSVHQSKTREHVWHIHGARAIGFLLTIFSFLMPRRRTQVRAALQLLVPPTPSTGTEGADLTRRVS